MTIGRWIEGRGLPRLRLQQELGSCEAPEEPHGRKAKHKSPSNAGKRLNQRLHPARY